MHINFFYLLRVWYIRPIKAAVFFCFLLSSVLYVFADLKPKLQRAANPDGGHLGKGAVRGSRYVVREVRGQACGRPCHDNLYLVVTAVSFLVAVRLYPR